MRIDLHMHSSASDGDCSPADVVGYAANGRLDVIALTDHDTVAGVREARSVGGDVAIEVIPGIEVSSTWEGHDVHVLGYFVDLDAPLLLAHAERARGRREERMREMVDRLVDLGMEIAFQDVLDAAGAETESLARPHLAQALIDKGHVSSYSEAFDRYIGDHGPAFVPTAVQDPVEAVEMIDASGGLAVWAHPSRDRLDLLLPPMVEAGLAGLEALRPNHPPDYVKELMLRADRYDLVITGGSDWHGPDRGRDLGDFYVTADEIGAFLDRGGL